MASPRPAAAASPGGAASPAPGSSRALPLSPLGNQAIWRRLRDSGFDEESIKRRDKAALIAYVAKLEAEVRGASPVLFSQCLGEYPFCCGACWVRFLVFEFASFLLLLR